MNYTIKNQYLAVEISSSGGELRSVRDSEGTEYLWQGDPDSWEERGPNLFPYIGRTTRQTYTYQGKEYHMPLHGFLIGSEMELADRTDDSLSLCLKTSQKTLEIWPFHFCLTITWKLDGSTLVFDDYRIDFGKNASPQQILLSDDCFILEKNVPLELEEGRYLPLSHELFARDAIVMKNMPKKITIESPKSHRKIHAAFPDMDYLGLWNCGNAPFVCIEPWSSLPSRKDLVEDLETQPNLISLEAGKKYVNTWSVSVISDIEN